MQVHGTIKGYGERCDNANLCSVRSTLKLKLRINCVADRQLGKLTGVSRYIPELANMPRYDRLPYVGNDAFTHTARIHVSDLMKCEDSYQHVGPNLVGNRPHMVASELAGKGSIVFRAREQGLPAPEGQAIEQVLERVKVLEKQGSQYDVADASFNLLLRRVQSGYRPPCELIDFVIAAEKRHRLPTRANHEEPLSEAAIKAKPDNRVAIRPLRVMARSMPLTKPFVGLCSGSILN
jgi:2-isopropylmalate synthase